MAGKTLSESRLLQEGITVLGIHRENGDYVGVPRGETRVHARDRLVLYGHEDALDELEERRASAAGDRAHEQAVENTRRSRASQQRRDEKSPASG